MLQKRRVMDFVAEVHVTVPDERADVIMDFPDKIFEGFHGTGIQVNRVTVINKEP